MGRTKKPCPGCGEVDPYRAADKLCNQCQTILFEEKKARETLETFLSDKDFTKVNIGTRRWDFDMPKGIYKASGSSTAGSPIVRRIEEILFEFLGKISTPCRDDCSAPSFIRESYGAGRQTVYLPTPIAEHLPELLEMVGKAVESAYDEGKNDGRRMLGQLARGEMSISDFEKF